MSKLSTYADLLAGKTIKIWLKTINVFKEMFTLLECSVPMHEHGPPRIPLFHTGNNDPHEILTGFT